MLRAIPSRRTGQPRYHFRRIVPALLRPLLGKTEISLVLHTSDKLVARERAAALYARTGQLFRAGKMQHPTKDDLLALYRDLIESYEAALKAQEESAAKVLEAERAQHLIEKADLVTKQSTFLNTVLPHMEGILKGSGQLRHTLEKREVWAVTEKQGLQNQITGDVVGEFYDLLSGLPTTHGKGKVTPPSGRCQRS